MRLWLQRLQKSGTRGHKRESPQPTCLQVPKLKQSTFKSHLICSSLIQSPEAKKQFQHGVSMERLQKDYLESYKKAMLWNVILYSNTSMIGMVSSLTVYFYKEVWATFGFISYKSMKGFRTCCFGGIGVGLGEFFFSIMFASGRFYQKFLL